MCTIILPELTKVENRIDLIWFGLAGDQSWSVSGKSSPLINGRSNSTCQVWFGLVWQNRIDLIWFGLAGDEGWSVSGKSSSH